VRRLLLVNALIFAVLAAAVALAYYGYSYTTEVASRERALLSLQDLADEMVLDIESRVIRDDTTLLDEVRIDEIEKLDDKVRSTRAGVTSVFVLDDQLQLPLGGSWTVGSRDAKTAVAIRDWYLANVIPTLGLPKLPLDQRVHHYGHGPNDEPYVLSYMHKQFAGKSYYVVIEDDVAHFVFWLFPQYFSERSNHLYQVVDENKVLRFGIPFSIDPGGLMVKAEFTDTLDGWQLWFAEKDPNVEDDLRRKRIIDSLLIGGAVTVILAGLAFLALAIRRERRANELKSDFISNVSHELKTPLSIISMFGEMLANNRTKSPEQATEYAEIIWRESVRLGRLIDNVLDFAKIERGAIYEFGEADIGDVVARAIDLATRRLANADVTLDAEIEPDLPIVKLDANAFTLAVLNLIDNAIKYAADGKRIELHLAQVGDRIVLTVRDFGPGIDPEEHGRIFERFYRARAMRLKPIRGSGIGLALVQHIARAHGGDIAVTSAPGSGATFELWVPV
jgi:two-component system, OmpR family, phosphate regulon sensor histidine kinase PhoR